MTKTELEKITREIWEKYNASGKPDGTIELLSRVLPIDPDPAPPAKTKGEEIAEEFRLVGGSNEICRIAAAIDKAIAEEREACAVTAWNAEPEGEDESLLVAAVKSIRARGSR